MNTRNIRKFLKICTFTIALSVSSAYAVDTLQDMCQHECVHTVNLSHALNWDSVYRLNKEDQCWEICDNIFEQIGYKDGSYKCELNRQGCIDSDLLFFKENQDINDFVFVHVEYSKRSRSMHFSKAKCQLIDPKTSNFIYKEAYVLSWLHVRYSFDFQININKYIKPILQNYYPTKIKEATTRIGIVINDDFTISLYCAYNNEIERNKSLNIIQQIKDYFSTL